jgi:hypothetical protein
MILIKVRTASLATLTVREVRPQCLLLLTLTVVWDVINWKIYITA